MQYLMTLEELYAHAAAKLGSMSDGSYHRFAEKAKALAPAHGITNPKLVIDIKFKSGTASDHGVTEQPYPISAAEWEQVRDDAVEMAEYIPDVYLVDGDQFTAPI